MYVLQKWWDCWDARSNHADLKLSYPRCIHISGICFEIDLYLLVVNSMNAKFHINIFVALPRGNVLKVDNHKECNIHPKFAESFIPVASKYEMLNNM